MKKSVFHVFQVVSFVAGISLFVYLLRQTGLAALGDHLGALGWGFVVIIALSAVHNCLRAGSWYVAIEPSDRGIR